LDLTYQPWPRFDPALLVEDTLEIPVQVNGKLRHKILVPAQATPQEMEAAALKAEKAQPYLGGRQSRR
jgi:leucyl-tRNA synthetase